MNRNGIIYLVVSILAVFIVSYCVLAHDTGTNDNEITVTVMNSNTIICTSAIVTETTISSSAHIVTTDTTVEYTYTITTTSSSISTNTEPVETATEPTTALYEEIYVDINTADMDSLMKINGIGEVTAMEIINYREQNGGFRNIEEIMNVYGIGEATFEHICGYIYVENPVYDIEDEVTEEIPEPETEQEIISEPEVTLEDVAPININTADLETLLLLPHVNQQIAQDIITLREQLHGFSHVYELLYVEKLEQKQVAEMEEFVTVGQ